MADSLFDILSRKDFSEPPEVTAIKQYIMEHFRVDAEVLNRDYEIIITVPSAALAGTLRFHATKLQHAANTQKRLVLRISQ
jgi:hypothetical protein